MNTTPNLSQEEHNLILYLVIAKKYEIKKEKGNIFVNKKHCKIFYTGLI